MYFAHGIARDLRTLKSTHSAYLVTLCRCFNRSVTTVGRKTRPPARVQAKATLLSEKVLTVSGCPELNLKRLFAFVCGELFLFAVVVTTFSTHPFCETSRNATLFRFGR